jgi:hypothetical protein
MARAGQNERRLDPWRASLDQAVATGELYSLTVPLTPVERCNDRGQVHGGPVVAVVDPTTYSAGDLFAAGFVDNTLGTLVSVGLATGGGGANVWTPADVDDALDGTGFAVPPLPEGIGYTLAVRRATRAGEAGGAAIEDLGIAGHRTYPMTRDDLVDDNHDLLAFCARLLADQPRTRLRAVLAADGATVDLTSEGLDRLELRVDDEALGSQPLADGPTTITLPATWTTTVDLAAYGGPTLLQRRLLRR